ncbi:MAG: PAS domain S-box protein, partial [Desulfoplanes sp.]
MIHKDTKNKHYEAMRREAERRAALNPEVLEVMSVEEIRHVLHELQVHQIELEIQNENLRAAHAQLDEVRALYFDLYDLAPVGYVTLSETELILKSNLTAVTLLGTTRSALINRPISQFIVNEDQDIYYLYRKKLLGTGSMQMCELRMRRGDGGVFWAQLTATTVPNADGTITSRVTLSDITARKQAEAEKDRLLEAIRQAAESILITDSKGTMEYVNPAFEKITGYSSEETIGQTPHILMSGQHDDAFYKNLWSVLLRGEIWRGRFINKKKDGTFYTEEATISPVKNSDGHIVNYVAVKRDITNEMKLEEQLRQSQKMESLGQLVGGVAHGFNNLIQVINGQAEMAQMQMSANRSPADNINEIFKAGEYAKNLVQQLLIFCRRQVIDPMDLDLNKEIENAQRMMRPLIGTHIRFTFIPGQGLGPIFADKSQIHQVLMNLCMNAHDAMPDGGVLTLKTESVLIGPEDLKTQTWAHPGRYILLSVTDTGCGMEKTICEKIFDPFFTTKEVDKGTGLGLSTVYGIVQQNKGH